MVQREGAPSGPPVGERIAEGECVVLVQVINIAECLTPQELTRQCARHAYRRLPPCSDSCGAQGPEIALVEQPRGLRYCFLLCCHLSLLIFDDDIQSHEKVIPVDVLPTPLGMHVAVDNRQTLGLHPSVGGPAPRRTMQSQAAPVVSKAGGRAVTALAPKHVAVGGLNGVGDVSCPQTRAEPGESGSSYGPNERHTTL